MVPEGQWCPPGMANIMAAIMAVQTSAIRMTCGPAMPASTNTPAMISIGKRKPCVVPVSVFTGGFW